MAMKPMKKAAAPKKKPSKIKPVSGGSTSVNPYAASGTGYKHVTGAASGRMVVSRPKAITKVNGKVVPLPKNALQDNRKALPYGARTMEATKATKAKKKSPITSIGGYLGRNWDGTKIKPLTVAGTPAKIKNNTKFSGTTVIAKGSAAAKANVVAKKAVAAAAKKKAAAAAKKKTTSKTPKATAPKGTVSIGGISFKK
jgi:hypothetical protein